MNFLKRNKRRIYICEEVFENGITTFKPPKELMVNFRPISPLKSLSAVQKFQGFGLEETIFLNIKCGKDKKKYFKSGNKCYVYVNPPQIPDELCKECDFVVFAEPFESLDSIEVMLKKLL